MKLRIKFRKYGPLRFIGHLDVMRFFQKAVRRAGVDVAYSGGFSPHQIMSFAAPLGVGLESNGEYMDIEVNSLSSCQEVKENLNHASVPGIEIVSVIVLPENAGNAMASVAAASYTVRFREGREPDFWKNLTLPDAVDALLEAFLLQEHIFFSKETKKGSREIDLRPGIYEFVWDREKNAFFLLVDASSAGNIKPIQVFEALLAGQGECLKENALLITREETFADIGENGIRKLAPLGELAE
ncbi:MAG: TIGR03936 family radical SAM-associated protein [Lachnoclostridium sp.]|nr:TIGR03936 family radical SAM-associated protein [Lachnospira sp.]MCM1248088.1 TIGR03936 family radical SAM-associated protein [Lachnoclostridium sp.]